LPKINGINGINGIKPIPGQITLIIGTTRTIHFYRYFWGMPMQAVSIKYKKRPEYHQKYVFHIHVGELILSCYAFA